MKKNLDNKGEITFGTEIIFSKKDNFSALLGASPGASTSCHIMIQILKQIYEGKDLSKKLKKISPSYGVDFNKNTNLLKKLRKKIYKNIKLL
jgi:malate dehydrogenase (quinone)